MKMQAAKNEFATISSKRISPQCFQLQKTYYIWLQQQLRVSDNSPKSRRKTLASRDALKVFLFSTTKKEKHCNALELSRLKEGFCIQFFRPRTRPRTFLQCFALEQRESKAQHCRNVLGRVLGRKTRYKIGPLVQMYLLGNYKLLTCCFKNWLGTNEMTFSVVH